MIESISDFVSIATLVFFVVAALKVFYDVSLQHKEDVEKRREAFYYMLYDDDDDESGDSDKGPYYEE